MGISEKEKNPIILLSTIGKRGPSSLVFEPHYEKLIDARILKKFREELGLTTREFSDCFDITQSALVNIEKNKLSGKEIFKRLDLYVTFPEAAIYQIKISGGKLHSEKQKTVFEKIKKMKEASKAP